jgi:hypothetical protein
MRWIAAGLPLMHVVLADIVFDPNVERRRYLLKSAGHLAVTPDIQPFHGAVGPARCICGARDIARIRLLPTLP